MGYKQRLWAPLATALVVSGCAAATPYNPFKIPESDVRARVKTIALAPLTLPDDIDDPEPVKSKFESLIAGAFRQAGFTVTTSADYASIWKRVTEELGGFFNPITGKRNEDKYKAARDHTLRELAVKTKADAVLYSAIVIVKAPFQQNLAQWHGTNERVITGRPLEVFFAGQHAGTVAALSLFVRLSDLNNVDMYLNAGGLQLAAKVFKGNFVPVPRRELFADEERNRDAVNMAIRPFLPPTD